MMERASWLKLFERWFQPLKNSNNANVAHGPQFPCDAKVFVSRSLCSSVDTEHSEIQVAVAPDDSQHERVHTGHYLIPEVEACALYGKDGVFLIPWPNITWIRS